MSTAQHTGTESACSTPREVSVLPEIASVTGNPWFPALLVLMVLRSPSLNTQSAHPSLTFGDAMAWYEVRYRVWMVVNL